MSFDAEIAHRIEAAAHEDGVPFSTWLAAAAERDLTLREGRRGVAEWEAENGPITAAERAASNRGHIEFVADAAGRRIVIHPV